MTKKTIALIDRLKDIGFTTEEAMTLRRCEMTLHRWAEQECGDSNDFASWSIERDETTGKPFRVVYPHKRETRRYSIPDREKGALKRAGAIITAKGLRLYHQTDPRGCALYIMREGDSCYTHGVAVCE